MQAAHDLLQQLLNDPKFIAWVQHPTPELDARWQAWIGQDDVRRALAEDARKILCSVSGPAEPMPASQKAALKQRIQQSLGHATAGPISPDKARVRRLPVLRYAAALAGLLLVSGWLYSYLNPLATYQTGYGEVTTHTLPDGTVVTLNANSTLTFRSEEQREAWIRGEAYFWVKPHQHQGQPVPFVVHAERLDIAVLGTKFNVHTRRGATRVTLSEGKVALKAPEAGAPSLTMKPGDHAVLAPQQRLKVSQVDPLQYTSWKEKQLTFDRTSIREIATVIEDIYGLEVVVEDQHLQKRTFTGTLPSNDVNLVFAMLEEIFNLQVEKNGNRVVMKPPARVAVP